MIDLTPIRLWPAAQDDIAQGRWKLEPEDFVVEEIWQPEQQGQGEHVLLLIEKVGQNTEWVARQIARHAGIRDFDVGLHGLKDRHAVTRQWMSVYLGKRPEPDWAALEIEGTKILQVTRTPKKLRRGEHQGNRFQIRVRDIKGDMALLNERLQALKAGGFPNLFGMQRFGHDGYNLEQAEAWFSGSGKPKKKAQKGLYLSAARSYLFNCILHERIRRQSWNQLIDGDLPMAVQTALEVGTDQVPGGPLLGGAEFLDGVAGEIERSSVAGFDHWLSGLHKEGVRTARRPFLAAAEQLQWDIEGEVLTLGVVLGTGCFASVLLEQCFELN